MATEFDRIGGYYNRLVTQHGHCPRACDYGRPESQEQKFAVLCEGHPMNGRRVLDVGCGFADFAVYLEERFRRITYSGIDLSRQMVTTARELRPQYEILHGNVLTRDLPGHDIVTANGIFYLLGEKAEELAKQLIARMFAIAGEALLFNSLSTWTPSPEPNEYYADPAELLAFCRTLTPWVVLRHDYHPHDFTIYMYKQARHDRLD